MVLALLLIASPLAAPAQAAIEPEPVRGSVSERNANTDIVITSLGSGRAVSGALPPLGSTWPVATYPTTIPGDYERENVSFAGIINTEDAYGTTAEMYCIDLRTSTRVNVGYGGGTWDESNVPNIGYVNRILNTYYPSSDLPAGLDNNTRAAAVQAAIWFFTDGYIVDPDSSLYPIVAGIVNDTIEAGILEEPDPPAIAITPPATGAPVTGVAGPHTVTSEADEIEVTTDEGFSLYADAAGTIPLNSPVPSGTQVWVRSDTGATGPANISARAAVSVPTGNVYLYDGGTTGLDNAQKLILAVTRELSSNATASVTFTEVGSLAVTKSIEGPAAGSQDALVISIDCGPGYQFTFNIDAKTTGTLSETFNDIPAGTACSITEPTNGGNDSVQVSTILPGDVTIVSGTTVTATVTDTYTFAPGTLVVRKDITGDGAGRQGVVTLQVTCSSGLNQTITIAAGTVEPTTEEFTGLPAGTTCTVTETADGATTQVSVEAVVDPAGGTVTIPAGNGVEVVVTDTYTVNPGALIVDKVITGPAAREQGPITVTVICTMGREEVIRQDLTIEAGAGGTVPGTVSGIPEGAVCSVTEPVTGENDVVTVVTDLPGDIEIIAGETINTTVTNTYSFAQGELAVTKVIAGEAAGRQSEVVLQVSCGPDGSVLDETVTIPAGTTEAVTTTFADLPAGTECAVTETTGGETSTVNVMADLPDPVIIPARGGVEIFVTNTYSPVIAPTPKPQPTPAPEKQFRTQLASTGAAGITGLLAAGASLLLVGGLALKANRRRANIAEDSGSDQQ
ncbi:thioester domain-containing protein [Arthrobacter jiangjiafuii]|uniref:Thioester domain-containing protein n=1 Tax=Arthrobacter jiangjiafuii TaxID=2817475 RepID=A0A975M7D5_9MICC|nr:thioester domain-containing protein [Arthrobacter jiangjiafuii]QWC11034.1 thioester domain-containing protein [Arthrobacter jiangjiafuii]